LSSLAEAYEEEGRTKAPLDFNVKQQQLKIGMEHTAEPPNTPPRTTRSDTRDRSGLLHPHAI
jgi:hypothetical protein